MTEEVKATKQKLDEITAEKETLVKKVEELKHEMEVRIQEVRVRCPTCVHEVQYRDIVQ